MARSRFARNDKVKSPKAARRPIRVPVGGVLVAALTLLVCAAPAVLTVVNPVSKAPGSASSLDKSLGYNALIDDLVVARGWLEMRRTASGYAVVETDLAPKGDVWDRFKRRTYLGADMKDPSRWIVSDFRSSRAGQETLEIAGIDPAAHQVAGPFEVGGGWRGSVLYRPEQEPVAGLIRRLDQTASAVRQPGMILKFQAGPGTDRRGAEVALFAEGPAQGLAPVWRYRFRDSRSGCGQEVASVMRIGSDSSGSALVRLLRDRSDKPGCAVTVKIGGKVRRTDAPQYLRLALGESLAFEAPSRNGGPPMSWVFDYGSTAQAISTPPTPGRDRTRARGLESFSRGVEALAAGAKVDEVRTTLDAGLQAAADAALGREGALINDAGLPARASITLMDANTGEVLAVATRPLPDNQASPFARLGRTDRNHNFSAMPVGSVAKAPLTLAILQTWPALAGFRLDAKGDFKEVVGVQAEFKDTASAGRLNVVDFLARSSNRYAVGLMILALSDDPTTPDPALAAGTDCYWIGEAQSCRPPRIEGLSGAPGPDGYLLGGHVGELAWRSSLERTFGVLTEFEHGAGGGATDLWPGLAQPSAAGGDGVFMDEVNLGLNQIVDVRQDYLMSILGGNRSRWPSIKIAEVFSRIVTRREVHARLTRPGGMPLAGPLRVDNPAAWNAVLQGMNAVAVGGNGTATNFLKGSIPAGYRVFAKTGTPALAIAVPDGPARTAVARLAARRCGLTWDPKARRIVVPDDMRPLCVEILRTAGPLDKTLETMSAAYASRLGYNQRVRAHPVLDLAPESAWSEGEGHGIALVIGRYPGGAASCPGLAGVQAGVPCGAPQRALTIVVNLETHSVNGQPRAAPATDMAAELLASPVVRAWLVRDPDPVPTAGQGAGR